jgi:hypothetical protein
MILALAQAHPETPAFSSLYYATIATVIPVLFCAIAVQAPSTRTSSARQAGQPPGAGQQAATRTEP